MPMLMPLPMLMPMPVTSPAQATPFECSKLTAQHKGYHAAQQQADLGEHRPHAGPQLRQRVLELLQKRQQLRGIPLHDCARLVCAKSSGAVPLQPLHVHPAAGLRRVCVGSVAGTRLGQVALSGRQHSSVMLRTFLLPGAPEQTPIHSAASWKVGRLTSAPGLPRCCPAQALHLRPPPPRCCWRHRLRLLTPPCKMRLMPPLRKPSTRSRDQMAPFGCTLGVCRAPGCSCSLPGNRCASS
jgi:hypothetical protein